MVDTKKVKFARSVKNTAGFFTLLYAITQFVYFVGSVWLYGEIEGSDSAFVTGMLGITVIHIILAIALFTATTPKWLWFPIGVLTLLNVYSLYDFIIRFANNGYNMNLVMALDIYTVCTSLGYILLFIMLFAKGFARSMWLVPAILLSVQSFTYAIESGKGLSDYIEILKSGDTIIGVMLLSSFLGDVLYVISVFITCYYVGKYSKQRLLFKRYENSPSAPAASSPASPLANSTSNGSVNANPAPKQAPTSPSQPSADAPSVNIDSKLGVKSDSKPISTPSITEDATVTLDDSLAAEIESGLGESSSDDTSSEEEDLASEIDKLMGN